MTCDACPSPAVVVSPGTAATRDLFLLAAGEAMRCWCLPHAQAAGWPWLASERTGRAA